MWSILYVADGQIFQLGPFATEVEALRAGLDAQVQHSGTWEDEAGSPDSGEYDIRDQNVYLIGPDHHLSTLSQRDLGVEDVIPHPGLKDVFAKMDSTWEEHCHGSDLEDK